jgi:hypothetical protein
MIISNHLTTRPDMSAHVAKKRKQRNDGLCASVDISIAEFVYCHCKFEEKTYVCLYSKKVRSNPKHALPQTNQQVPFIQTRARDETPIDL